MLGKSAARVLICKRQVGEADYAALVDGLRPALPALAHVLVHGERYQDWPDLDQCWEGPAWSIEGQRVDPDAGARLIASSGSESEPKLVLYSHNALVGGQSAYLNGLARQPEAMRALFAVPLASPFGSLGTPCTLASLGGALICLDRFEADAVLRLVAQQRVTHLFAGPNMVDMLLASPCCNRRKGRRWISARWRPSSAAARPSAPRPWPACVGTSAVPWCSPTARRTAWPATPPWTTPPR